MSDNFEQKEVILAKCTIFNWTTYHGNSNPRDTFFPAELEAVVFLPDSGKSTSILEEVDDNFIFFTESVSIASTSAILDVNSSSHV